MFLQRYLKRELFARTVRLHEREVYTEAMSDAIERRMHSTMFTIATFNLLRVDYSCLQFTSIFHDKPFTVEKKL